MAQALARLDAQMTEQERGIFIVFEGVDGAGKSTQIDMLQQALSEVGYQVVTSREPTDKEWGRKIRRSATTGRMPLADELDAFIRDRKQHIAELIGPELQRGKIVLVDRYFYSTIAYQGERGGDVAEIEKTMREFAPIPDFVLLLDADPDVTLPRITDNRGGTDEFEHVASLRRIRELFLMLSESCEEVYRVDAHQEINALHLELLGLLCEQAQHRERAADETDTTCPFRQGNSPWALFHARLSKYLAPSS